nr:hypothetical protein [Roseibaca sp.]
MIHHTPGPMLAVLPTVEMAKRTSRGRIDPLVAPEQQLFILLQRLLRDRLGKADDGRVVFRGPRSLEARAQHLETEFLKFPAGADL